MRRLLIIPMLLATSCAFAQDGFKVTRASGSGSYQQAYLACSSNELKQLVVDHATATPSAKAKNFFKKFPILDEMSMFKKKQRYSLINIKLLARAPEMTDDNKLIFTFKNGQTYTLNLIDRIHKVY